MDQQAGGLEGDSPRRQPSAHSQAVWVALANQVERAREARWAGITCASSLWALSMALCPL